MISAEQARNILANTEEDYVLSKLNFDIDKLDNVIKDVARHGRSHIKIYLKYNEPMSEFVDFGMCKGYVDLVDEDSFRLVLINSTEHFTDKDLEDIKNSFINNGFIVNEEFNTDNRAALTIKW